MGLGYEIVVEFSREVTTQLFWSHDPILKRAARRTLRAILHDTGRGRGIVALAMFTDVYEVRIVGSSLPMRIAGFAKGRHFYFVYYTNRSDHGSRNYVQALVNAVRSAAKQHDNN